MNGKPIARCVANEVYAYEYPFYVKPAKGVEPDYIFLEHHVYTFHNNEVKIIMGDLIRIEQEKDLQALGFEKDEDGIYILSPVDKPWMHGGES